MNCTAAATSAALLFCACALFLSACSNTIPRRAAKSAESANPPVIPIGHDAYRAWDRWPYQRIGARAYMRSTYDRAGGDESADASHFLYHQYVAGTKLSQQIKSWDAKTPPPQDVLDLIARAGSDLVSLPNEKPFQNHSGVVDLKPGETRELIELKEAPSMLRALNLSIPR